MEGDAVDAPEKALPRWTFALGIAGLVAGIVAVSARLLGDFDLPWHLAVGRVIASTRSLPRVDDLAFTHRPVQHADVISDLLLYAVAAATGPLGLQIVGGLCAGLVALLLFLRARSAGPLALLAAGLGAATMGAWLIVRPATFSFVLLALELYLIERHRAATRRSEKTRALWTLVPLHMAWANIHGFVVVGITVLGMYAGYRLTAHVARGRAGAFLPEEDGREARTTCLVFVASLAAACVNMAGPVLFLGPLRASADFRQVTEWATTTSSFLIQQEPLAGIALVAVLAALAFGKDAETGRRMPNAFDVGLLVAAFVLGRSAVRLIPVAAILAMPFAAQRLGSFVPATRVTVLACAASTLLVGPFLALRASADLGVGFDARHLPEGAVRYVERAQPAGPMWNFFPYGGYLSWRLYPRYRVFLDGRSGWVHDPALFARGIESERNLKTFHELATELRMELAVCRAAESEDGGPALAAAQDWGMVYWDDHSVVYVRHGGPNEALAKEGYRLLRHRSSLDQVLALALSPGDRAADLAHDAALAVAQDPKSPRAAFLGSCGALAEGDPAKLAASIENLARLAPGHPALGVLQSAGLARMPRALPGTSP